MKRNEMLKLLKSIKKPSSEDLGSCIAGHDEQVVTAEGTALVCVQSGHGPRGPVCLEPDSYKRLVAAREEGEDEFYDAIENEKDLHGHWEDEYCAEFVKEMLDAGCEPGKHYFYMWMADGCPREFSTDREALEDAWVGSLCDGAEDWETWDSMEDGELAQWVKTFGLAPKAAPKSRRRKQ